MTNPEYMTGAQLLAQWPKDTTREQRLARACVALMHELDVIHNEGMGLSLRENIENPTCTCSCADAYRMGYEALKS